MKPTLSVIVVFALSISATLAAESVSVSGIYPHLTVFNSDPKREKPEMECGLRAAVPWAGKLWSMTYTSHALVAAMTTLPHLVGTPNACCSIVITMDFVS